MDFDTFMSAIGFASVVGRAVSTLAPIIGKMSEVKFGDVDRFAAERFSVQAFDDASCNDIGLYANQSVVFLFLADLMQLNSDADDMPRFFKEATRQMWTQMFFNVG